MTVKLHRDGYLIDGTTVVPKVDGNRHYEAVKTWLDEGNTPEPEFTDAELLERADVEARDAAKAGGEVYPLNGVDYQVPFRKDDADGLMQANAAFTLGLTETVIHFTNGVKMPITAAEFQDFATWFVTKRNEFFTA